MMTDGSITLCLSPSANYFERMYWHVHGCYTNAASDPQ